VGWVWGRDRGGGGGGGGGGHAGGGGGGGENQAYEKAMVASARGISSDCLSQLAVISSPADSQNEERRSNRCEHRRGEGSVYVVTHQLEKGWGRRP